MIIIYIYIVRYYLSQAKVISLIHSYLVHVCVCMYVENRKYTLLAHLTYTITVLLIINTLDPQNLLTV